LKKFSSKNGVQAVGKGSSGCRRGLGSRDSLIIIASSMTFVNRFLQVFLISATGTIDAKEIKRSFASFLYMEL